jgi:hypothetical protein
MDLSGQQLVELPADRPPWYDTGIDLAEGEFVTWLAGGRCISRLLDIFIGPHFQPGRERRWTGSRYAGHAYVPRRQAGPPPPAITSRGMGLPSGTLRRRCVPRVTGGWRRSFSLGRKSARRPSHLSLRRLLVDLEIDRLTNPSFVDG